MKILVTGGSGFIGSRTVQALVENGHQVAALSRNLAPQPLDGANHITYLRGSIAKPPWEEIKNFTPEACLHSAWITTPGIYLTSELNEILAVESLAFLKRLEKEGVNKIVSLGTCVEYDIFDGEPLREDVSLPAPKNSYSLAKTRLHEDLKNSLSPDTSLIWARIFYPYGRGEHPERLSSHLIRQAYRGEPLELRQPRNVLDYIHIDDVSAALVTVLESFSEGSINIGTGRGISVKSLAQEVCKQMDCLDLLRIRDDGFGREPSRIVADNSKLQSLGWKPAVSLESGLRDLIDSLQLAV